ncbi:MAG TPA: hypothetical protein VN714_01610 [Trebonia sp.]|jgi:hypothetical protein|nr:hypothetical protein [Trebonia sp.]
MSSAILYLAIVAIWACVLIPRWLRRDTARGVPAPVTPAAPPAVTEDGSLDDADEAVAPISAPARVVEPLSAEESRRRMLAARRRLLLMLIGLEIAAISLAVVGLAAVWVVIPPSIMLIGYVLLLREAGKADVERAQHEAEVAGRAREHAQARAPQAHRVTPVDGTSTEGIPEAAAALAAKFAAAPVPADYEDAGRDFAPGLAGKYTTSNADSERAESDESADDDDYYTSYEESPRLRAVGD